MSIKIHNGYRLGHPVAPGLPDDLDLFAFAERLRAIMNPIRDRLDAQVLMARAVHLVDLADRKAQERPRNPLARALSEHSQEQAKMNPAHCGHDPHRFEIAFLRDPLSGRTHALLYVDQPDFVDAFETLPEVESYGYWNNTDRPANLTESEWTERRNAWTRIGIINDAPVTRSLGFSLRPSVYDMGMRTLASPRSDQAAEEARLALLREAAPSLGDRARALALDMTCTEQKRRAEEAGVEFDPFSGVRALLFRDPEPTYQVVIDACAQTLSETVVDRVLFPPQDDEPNYVHPLYLDDVRAAVTAHLNATEGATDD